MHADPRTPPEATGGTCVPSMRIAIVQTVVATVWCAGILFATFTISVGDSDLRRLLAPHAPEPFRVQPLTLPRSAVAGGEGPAPDSGPAAARRRAGDGAAATPGTTAAGSGARRTGQIMTTISLSQATGPAPGAMTNPVTGTDGRGATLTLDGGGDGIEPRILVSGARPGSSGTMTIRVRNTGTVAAPLALTRKTITDRRGPYGGVLSSRLLLRVSDAGGRTRTTTPLASAGTVALGAVPPRGSRSWTVSLVFPDGGIPASGHSGDNAFQGSAVDARLEVVERPAR